MYLGIFISKLLPVLVVVFVVAVLANRLKRFKNKADDLFDKDLNLLGRQMLHEVQFSPKSVASMTKLYLPKIAKDFPEFKYDEMRQRSQSVLLEYLASITSGKVNIPEATEEVINEAKAKLKTLESGGLRETYADVRINDTEISQYRNEPGRCVITFQSSITCFHYVTDISGNIIRGSNTYQYQTRFDVDLVYIQDRSKLHEGMDGQGFICPHCGAAITSLGQKVCPYCDSSIIEINIHAWKFNNIEENF